MSFRWRQSGKREAVRILIGAAVLYAAAFYPWQGWGPRVAHAQQADTGYVDSATCAHCHEDIAKTYRQTGMGRSFHRADNVDRIEDFTTHNRLYNKASDRYYKLVQRDGKLYEQRHQIGFEGKDTNLEEMQIDYVVGSGNHARTYLHRTNEGKLIELPVSWYSEMGGYWEMSPGYDNPDQQDFRRPIVFECMSCHNAYPSLGAAATTSPDKNIFDEQIPEGIDCQRCHGPGGAHVRVASTKGASIESIRAAIVNPAKLSRDRQMDVCMQCHLETTSSELPGSLRKVDRVPFSYGPGQPLQDYELFFDHKPGTGYDDRLEVAHQAYRLRKSACFLKSQMTCTTCHNPHQAARGEEAIEHYVAVCSSCHADVHAAGIPGVIAPASKTTGTGPTCLTCHMWKRRTSDSVHVVMTDHYIQKYKPKGDLLAPIDETSPAYRGEVIPYYPDSFVAIPDGELYLSIAQTENASNLEMGTSRLRQAMEKYKPDNAIFYFAMGSAYAKSGKNKEAVPWFEEAIRRRPDYEQALRGLALTLAASGDLTRAAEVGEKAAATDHPDTTALTNLGSVYLHQGRNEDARRVIDRALRINPDLPDATTFLGLLASREGDVVRAESLFRSAINMQPDFAVPHNDLAGILAREGKYPEAEFHFSKAVEGDPTDPHVRHNYGVLLARTGPMDEALTQLKEAVRLDPSSVQFRLDLGDALVRAGFDSQAEQEYRATIKQDDTNGEAHLRLADLLARNGKSDDARQHYERAAESPDPKVRQAALAALRPRN
jgi:predicted CXXCH cytochrome family protein